MGTLVLMLHDVVESGDPSDPYTVTIDHLIELTQGLLTLGHRPVSMEQALERGDGVPPGLLITFDDARRGALLAVDSLGALGISPVVYAISGEVGRPGYLDARDLQALAGLGWTIGTHTVTHRYMSHLPPDEALDEWVRSKATLEDLTGVPILDAALPGGRGGAREASLAKEAGLRSLATSVPGIWEPSAGSRWRIPRVAARSDRTGRLTRLLAAGSTWPLTVLAWRYRALAFGRSILGDGLADGLRGLLTGWLQHGRGYG